MWHNVGIRVAGVLRTRPAVRDGFPLRQTIEAPARRQHTPSSPGSRLNSPFALPPSSTRLPLPSLPQSAPPSFSPWRTQLRNLHLRTQYASSQRTTRAVGWRRSSSTTSEGSKRGPDQSNPKSDQNQSKPEPEASKTAAAASSAAKSLLDRLPHIPHFHHPTKEELLAAATGFWSRLGIRFKWFSIKSVRPFNMDDISGFVSWILVGHVIWILVGTTTFFSLAILTVNTVFAQETLAGWVGNYLTQSSGLRVVFESAIVPKWKDGVITFSNVFVSRRPGQGPSRVTKGSQAEAAAAAAELYGKSVYDDGNYSQFDISMETVNVTLSFAKWFNGKGLLRDVEVRGMRGVIDRTHVKAVSPDVDPRSYRREHHAGDFELDSFKMEDVLVTVHQPNGFRPFSISIFSCDLPQLRQQWFFYDFMSANNMSGSIDNSLFTLHPRQVHNFNGSRTSNGEIEQDTPWKKQTRFRIDGLNIDHLNRGVEGPFSWIREGNVDIAADINLPIDDDESVAKVISDVIDRVEAVVTSNSIPIPAGKTANGSDALSSNDAHISTENDRNSKGTSSDARRYVAIDLRLHMNDVRAAVPIFAKDISYVNNALIRPIVAYINSRRSFIPINCRVVKYRTEFDGCWSMWESGLMDDLNMETYNAFVRDVLDDAQARRRRIKKVGIWTIQLAAQALFVGMAGNFA